MKLRQKYVAFSCLVNLSSMPVCIIIGNEMVHGMLTQAVADSCMTPCLSFYSEKEALRAKQHLGDCSM